MMKSCDSLISSLVSNDKRQLMVVLIVLLDLIAVFALLAQYYYTKLTFTDPPSWIQLYESKCPKHSVTNFSDGCLYSGGGSFFFFGGYLSLLMFPKQSQVAILDIKTNILRVCLGGCALLICFSPQLLAEERFTEPFTRFLVCYLIPAQVGGFLMFSPMDWLS